MESKDSSSPLSPPFTPIALSEEPPSPGAVPLLGTFMSVYVGVIDHPNGEIDVVGKCPEGYVLESHLGSHHLHVVIKKVEAEDESSQSNVSEEMRMYHCFQFSTEVVSGRNIIVEGDRITGMIRKV